jgi:hypothetical protein
MQAEYRRGIPGGCDQTAAVGGARRTRTQPRFSTLAQSFCSHFPQYPKTLAASPFGFLKMPPRVPPTRNGCHRTSDTGAHIHRVADLYRAFAAVAQIPWFRPYLLLLRWCVQTIHFRNPISFFWWRVNWSVIYSQIRTPTFETARLRWSQDPQTGRLVEPRHPCSPAIKCPPKMVRNPLESRRWKAL